VGAGLSLATRSLAGRFRGSMCRRWRRGIVETALRGYLAGYPVVDFKATVYDGSYHDVDSNEMSFKMAGGWLSQVHGAGQALPAGAGDEGGDRGSGGVCRGADGRPEWAARRVQGMESQGPTTVIAREVPMAEMLSYGTTLTSMTQGRGSYHMEMKHYDVVPQLVAEKILATAKRPVDGFCEGFLVTSLDPFACLSDAWSAADNRPICLVFRAGLVAVIAILLRHQRAGEIAKIQAPRPTRADFVSKAGC
jgi:elongation factor G